MNENTNRLFSKLVLSIVLTEKKPKDITYYIRYDIEPELDANNVESNLHKKWKTACLIQCLISLKL